MKHPIIFILGMATLSAVAFFFHMNPGDDEMKGFIVLVAMLSGTLLGFSMAALAILMSASETSLSNNLKKLGIYKELISSIYASAIAMFTTMGISVALFFWINKTLTSVIVFIFMSALLFMLQAGYRFFYVLKCISKPRGNPNALD